MTHIGNGKVVGEKDDKLEPRISFFGRVSRKEGSTFIILINGLASAVSSSNTQDVTLVGVTRNHTGRYSCEVTEDGPTYDTKVQEAYVLVVDVPETEPKIVVDREHLPAGETLRANCTSGASHPAPNITWTLNGAPLNNITMRFKVHTKTLPKAFDDRNSTFSSLNLETAGMFQDGRIRLRCFAEITPVYKASASKEITEEGPYLASITGDASPHSRHTSGSGRADSMSLWPCGLALNVVLGLLVGASST
ncbi:hypothetical protein TSAR_010667, partial [Trichomalopsis sarcophagae]